MIISIKEARDTLRVDDEDNDPIIEPLVEAIPYYLEVTTGKAWDDEPVHPLAKTVAKFLLQLWFDPQTQDSVRIQRTIDNLLTSLTAQARSM